MDFISVDEARQQILSKINALGVERVALDRALGRHLVESIACPNDVPPFDNSAMDGFAVRHEDIGRSLVVIGESAAGAPFDGVIGPGESVRIMTGAQVPEGADTVVMRENCTALGAQLTVNWSAVAGVGAYVRERGSYARIGDVVLRSSDVVGAGELSILASFGRSNVHVYRAPRVAILATGSELVDPSQQPGEGQIRDSNSAMLQALARQFGAADVSCVRVPDDETATRAALREAARNADLVITVGGVSVGDHDYMRRVLERETGGMVFWRVRMKPGKPLSFGVIEESGVCVIGLPGNPLSAFVCFHQFVRPALVALQGGSDSGRLVVDAIARHPIDSPVDRREYVPGRLRSDAHLGKPSSERGRKSEPGEMSQHGAMSEPREMGEPGEQHDLSAAMVFEACPNVASGNVLALAGVEVLAVVEEGVAHVEAGGRLRVEVL